MSKSNESYDRFAEHVASLHVDAEERGKELVRLYHENLDLKIENAKLRESAILTVASDMATFMDTLPQQPAWSEEWVNWLISYAEARGIDREHFVSTALTADTRSSEHP